MTEKARSRAKDLFAELDREIEKINKGNTLKFTKEAKSKAPAKAKAKAKAPAKAKAKSKDRDVKNGIRNAVVRYDTTDKEEQKRLKEQLGMPVDRPESPGKLNKTPVDRPAGKGKKQIRELSKGKTTTKQYDDSVTKTTTTPTTRNGRKGTEIKTVSSGNVKGGKTDNPELAKIAEGNKMRSKYGNLIRKHGVEWVRDQVKGSKSEEQFNKAYPKKKKK